MFLVGPRRRGVARTAAEEHLLSAIAAEPARLARFASGAGRRARGVSGPAHASQRGRFTFRRSSSRTMPSSAPACFSTRSSGSGCRQVRCDAVPRGPHVRHPRRSATIRSWRHAALRARRGGWLSLRAGRSEPSRASNFMARRSISAGRLHRQLAGALPGMPVPVLCRARARAEGRPRRRSDDDAEGARHLRPRVFEAFFEAWSRLGHRAITPDNLAEARTAFAEMIEPLLAMLPDDEAAVQRTRLLGSAADEGLAEAVFQIEAEWQTPVIERLLEHPLNGDFEIQRTTETRRVTLRGKADRIDLLADGTFRIIDYKLTRAPERKLALQLPIYTICTAQHLFEIRRRRGSRGRPDTSRSAETAGLCRCSDAAKTTTRRCATRRPGCSTTIDADRARRVSAAPRRLHLCIRCAHAAVCRRTTWAMSDWLPFTTNRRPL